MNKTEALPSKSLWSPGRPDPLINNSNRMWSVPTERSGRAPMGVERQAATSARGAGGSWRHKGLTVRKVLRELEGSTQIIYSVLSNLPP